LVPPEGFQFSHSRMGGLYYLLPLASFSTAVFSEDEDIKGATHWFFLLLGWFGLFVTTACLVFFKFYYWPRY
ncbi:hypothetical protein, partial [Vibrio harveyi]|uniref:hypothetical protein n=1 Tax=Vibrio harveyi TaxID=669 RepID=UPI001A7EAB0A